ncbi:Endothelial cell-specific molecule 1 [Branchiostoma belcheri]|nr:Endothelial cell-specific molecule 1 [Branchiostoma belcheri]
MFNMRKNTVSLVVIVCLLALSSWTSGVVVNLSAKIPENAGIGEQVIRVVPTAQGAKEEVPCKIIDGNIHGRFSVTRDCVIVVARPLDFGLNRRYNLTVAVPGAGTPETHYVDVQVEDVDGYPPIYNDTCELPVLGNDRAAAEFSINGIITGEYMEKGAGLFVLRIDSNQRLGGHDNKIGTYTDSDCHVTVVVGVTNVKDLRWLNGLWLSGFEFDHLRCFHPLDPEHVFEIGIIIGEPAYAHVDRMYVWTKYRFKLLISFIVKSTETHRLVCRLPHGRPVSVPISRGRVPDDVSVTRVELEIQPVGCPPNKYGLTCDQNCTCENGARCHGLSGACKCRPGWTGVACDIPHSTVVIIATPSGSSQIYIKGSLTLHCRSFHLAVEKMVWTFPNGTKKRLQGIQEDEIRIESVQSEHNGTYTCIVVTEDKAVVQASYELQAVACLPGKRGERCEDDCGCLQGAVCDRWAGCVCPPGWTGRICEARCPDGTYGRGCSDGACVRTVPHATLATGSVTAPMDGTVRTVPFHVRAASTDGDVGMPVAVRTTPRATMSMGVALVRRLGPVSIPLSLTLLGALAALYKWRRATRTKEGLEEAQVLLELSSVEEDLTQGLQPGWLKREGSLRTANADVTAVAVKSVRSENRLCYRAFCREVAMLVALSENCPDQNGHSNIIKLLGVIAKSSPMCILLEYAAKGDLLQLLKQQPRDNVARLLGRFLRYAVHVSRALKELRSLRIAHGDVAARNVLVTGDDVAKLSDFGLAHDVQKRGRRTLASEVDGSGVAGVSQVHVRERQWSFGVLLWEIATGGEEPDYRQELIQQSCPNGGLVGILRKGYRLQKPPGCPDGLYDVMTSCWQEKPSARPEPTELERRLTDCRQEMDPLFVIEKVSAL